MSLYDEVHREAMADYRAADLDDDRDLDYRIDSGEYEGEWVERQDARDEQ
jgi:hypothetical protein